MGGSNYLLGRRMRSYSLNIKTEGHLILPKMAWFLSYLTLKSGLYHFILGDVYMDRVVYPYTARHVVVLTKYRT